MKSAIRLDDITPDMDMERYGRVEKILDDNGIAPLIGVVPYNADPNLSRSRVSLNEERFIGFLKGRMDKGWKIALHGYNHLYSTNRKGIFPLNDFSEYAGVSLERQEEMLTEGLARLDELGVKTDIFMTPAHTYDRNTLKAMKSAGINYVTDGFGSRPYIRDGLVFYPISKRRSDCISDKEGYTTLVLHTNTMLDEDIDAFEKMITENRDKFIDYSEYMTIEPVRRGMIGNIIEYVTAYAKYVLVRMR